MKFKIISLLLSSALALAACGGDKVENKETNTNETKTEQTSQTNNSDDSTSDDNSDNNDDQSINFNDIKTSPEDAIKTAQSEVQGSLKSISFDKDDNKWVYDVSIIDSSNKKHELKIDADNNKIIKSEVDDDQDNEKEQTFDYGKFVPVDEVIKAAQAVYKGDVKEWSLDHDDGKFKYNIELKGKDGKTKEFEIDPENKKILSQDT
ncbi:PepSY domain-containing protein [Macrococcus armenti]|uniref:PepSY domain-containing protein n=1 Tax=Macrococcus armenti TaxID=2875764 RepID=UPI001CCFF76A|nr:PepSY domain-containing protein [Macrococcus armenti]UBH22560.1 PepSY domain-containing protein [Macrococcus armenti]